MSEPTNEYKCRVVAGRLGLWSKRLDTSVVGRHWVDTPPDFTQPAEAWRLVEALRNDGVTICCGPRWMIFHDSHGNNLAEGDDHDNLAQCLLDVAFKWAKGAE